MRPEALSIQEARSRLDSFPFAYIRRLSEVTLGKAPVQFDPAELIEARFFGPQGELRLYRDGGELKAALLTDGDETLDERYEIANTRFGHELTVRKTLNTDEDGQTCVAATRLLDWRE